MTFLIQTVLLRCDGHSHFLDNKKDQLSKAVCFSHMFSLIFMAIINIQHTKTSLFKFELLELYFLNVGMSRLDI